MQIQKVGQAQGYIKAAPFHRANTFGRNERVFGEIGYVGAKAGTAPLRTNRFPVINISLSSKTIIEVSAIQRDFKSDIPDERTQCKLITDIFPILKRYPEFKTHDKKWKNSTRPWEVLNWIALELNALGGKWLIGNHATENQDDYFIIVYREYSHDMNFHAIPLSFLPDMKKKSLLLHEMLISLIALLNKHIGIEKWDSGYGEMAITAMNEDWEQQQQEIEDEAEKERHLRCIKAYKNGLPKYYLNRINKNKSTITQLKNKIESFKPSDKIERDFSDWIKQGLKLLSLGRHIQSFCFNPNDPMYESENPLTPDRYICFIWDWNDKLYEYYNSYIQCDYENHGVIPLCDYVIWKKEDVELQILNDSDFPKKITAFFSLGIDLIQEHFKI